MGIRGGIRELLEMLLALESASVIKKKSRTPTKWLEPKGQPIV
jgi:hypothetical protein